MKLALLLAAAVILIRDPTGTGLFWPLVAILVLVPIEDGLDLSYPGKNWKI